VNPLPTGPTLHGPTLPRGPAREARDFSGRSGDRESCEGENFLVRAVAGDWSRLGSVATVGSWHGPSDIAGRSGDREDEHWGARAAAGDRWRPESFATGGHIARVAASSRSNARVLRAAGEANPKNLPISRSPCQKISSRRTSTSGVVGAAVVARAAGEASPINLAELLSSSPVKSRSAQECGMVIGSCRVERAAGEATPKNPPSLPRSTSPVDSRVAQACRPIAASLGGVRAAGEATPKDLPISRSPCQKISVRSASSPVVEGAGDRYGARGEVP
jgi:hypothetical protein